MILPNLRQQLTADDRGVVLTLLAGNDGSRRARLARIAEQRGFDTLLDDPDLPAVLQEAPGHAAPSAALYIYVSVRHVLLRSGIKDRRVAEYLGALVFGFAMRDRAWKIATHDDAVFRYLTDILAQAEAAPGRRGFLLRVHLGNFSLWLAGIFPDYVSARRARAGGPDFPYYDALGARGFRLASDDRFARQLEVADVYAKVAEQFAALRVALNRLSDRAFFAAHSSADRLMRQVADEFRFPLLDGPLA